MLINVYILIYASINSGAAPGENGVSAPAMEVDTPGSAPPVVPTLPVTEPTPVQQIDIPYEASQLPLDVAIYNCCRGVENEARLKKWLGSVLLVGGTSQVPGMSYQIESRCGALCIFSAQK